MVKSSGGYVYRGRDRTAEDVTRRSRQASGSYDGILVTDIPRLKVKEGESELRILPPTWEDTEKWGNGWEISVYLHYNVGPDGGSFLCLDKMKGESCPICEARRESHDEDERDQLRPSWRGLCWAIDRGNEKAGPQVWDMPATLFRDINARSIHKKTNAVICIDDPEEGNDLSVNREGTDKRTKYTVEVIHEACPIHDDEKLQARWMKYLLDNPLPDLLNFQEPDYIEKVLSGKISKKSEDEDGPAPDNEGFGRRPRARGEPEETEELEGRMPRGRRRSTEEADPTGDEPESRRSRREAEPEETEETDIRPSGRSGRRSGPEPEGEPDDPPPRRNRRSEPAEEVAEELPEESRTARKGLERLRPGARKAAAEGEESDDPPRRRRL